MNIYRRVMNGGIRQKVFSILLIVIGLIIAAYTTLLIYQSEMVEKLVDDTYEEQKQIFIDNGLEDQYETLQSNTIASFNDRMFHARNILVLLLISIVASGMAFAYSVTKQIIDPLSAITRRVSVLGVRNRQFTMEELYRTNDEIEVLAEAFAKQSARNMLYIEQIKRVTAEKERIGVELDMARKIQASQLPRNFDTFCDRREISLYASMRPAKEVGGDFYDFFMTDDDHVCIVIADVSGKGVPAALFMMISRVLLKTNLMRGESPSEAIFNLNNQLCETNETELFVTIWLAYIELSTGKTVSVNAGHEHPAIRRSGGNYELDEYKHSPPVGTVEGMSFREREFELFPGDSFFVYTDGVAEASNVKDQLFGTNRMLDQLNKNPDASPKDTLDEMMNAIDVFAAEAEQFDDITMVCLKFLH